MQSKADIFEYWKDWLDERGFDWGEPSCWACGHWWDTKYDVEDPNAPWEEIRKAWNKVPLQRCHIIPKSLGGEDEPSNLFLMCIECHDRAPDTTSREAFFKWVENQSWTGRMFKSIEEECKTFGFDEKTPKEIEELSDMLISKDFKEWARDKIGIHFSQSGYGSQITPSTIVALFWEYSKIKNNNL